MKKIILLLATLVIAISVSGCIGQQTPPTTTIPTTTPVTTAKSTISPTTIATTTPTTVQPQTAAIKIKSFSFNPSTLTVKIGTTVTWTNEDSTKHTVTSDSGNELNSPQLSQGQTYSHTFNQAGTYNYHCSIHYSMSGKVIVEQ